MENFNLSSKTFKTFSRSKSVIEPVPKSRNDLLKIEQKSLSRNTSAKPPIVSTRELIKNLAKEILCNSLSQAIIKIILTPYLFLKIILLLFVLVSSGLASYLVIQSILVYLSYNVSTTSRTIYETQTLFPKVTFCNYNSFTTEYAYNLTQMGILDGSSLSDGDKRRLGHDLNDILLDCSFNLIQCNVSDFTWSYDAYYGNCYTFNSGFDSNGNVIELKRSNLATPDSGLQLTLYVNAYEKFLDKWLNGLGIVLRVDNSSYSTFYLNNGIFVPSGFITYVLIDREFKLTLPKPFSNCEIDSTSAKFRENSELYNLIGQSKYGYSQQFCYTQCAQKYYIKKYNCALPFIFSLYNASSCSSNFTDLLPQNDNLLTKNYYNEECSRVCPLECNQTLYKTSTTQVQLVGNRFMKRIKNNLNLASDFINRTLSDTSTIEKSVVTVKLFYGSLSYTLTSESPQMDLVSLLASIGGNLSLFLGVSAFSLFEVVEVLIEIFCAIKIKK
jgi:hypothetical protein